jgi:hypothetical protein
VRSWREFVVELNSITPLTSHNFTKHTAQASSLVLIDAPQPIAMDDKDNANPTILNASDLPSRHRESTVKKREDGGTGLFDDLIPQYTYLSDPFDQPLSASDSDDDSVEDIDEQEVYGESQSHLQSFV